MGYKEALDTMMGKPKRKPRRKSWVFTHPETRETYRFVKEGDTIITQEFLGWKTPKGKLIKPRLKKLGERRKRR